ncbi:chromosome segregation ATPase [Polaromonas sp. CG_9.5]|uniref:hypothetical protein n=1 Tax=Polaromonas sp. CG_9.5 TaxID=3071705 RepID=UPI002DF8A9CB|nr:chromosome segregation ATPase [Polaromonas sp. CG_9.5]
MDSQTLTVLTGAASLVVGVLACWLVMRGRIAGAATQGNSKTEAELVKAKEHIRALTDARQAATTASEALTAQAAQSREALAQARKEQGQLTERAAQVAKLEAELLALQTQEKASQLTLQRLKTNDADSNQSLKRASEQLAQVEGENATLKRSLADVSATLEALNARPAIKPEMQASQLPVLEAEVLELQSLAKTIKQEFLVLQEVQRNFTAASSALQDVS